MFAIGRHVAATLNDLPNDLIAVEACADTIERRQPPSKSGKRLKFYYATQVAVCPPVFVVFVNEPKAFPNDYRRYLANALREALDFEEIPIQVLFRKRESLYHD